LAGMHRCLASGFGVPLLYFRVYYESKFKR
jgi:hypothetical protein